MKYSVVIPLKDEEENIPGLIEEVEQALSPTKEPWELICIDDGSTDNTLTILKKIAQEKKYLQILSFTQNYGQSSAFDAGFQTAKGEFVITLDGDGQNDPADIPQLIAQSAEIDLVVGCRTKRKDTFLKRTLSSLARSTRKALLGDPVKDTGCSLKLYRSSSLKKIKMFHGMHRFLPALFAIEGFEVREIPVNHRKRTGGKSKYSLFNRSFNTISDLFAVRWMKKRALRYQIKKEI